MSSRARLRNFNLPLILSFVMSSSDVEQNRAVFHNPSRHISSHNFFIYFDIPAR
jgi:hypothetical protein